MNTICLRCGKISITDNISSKIEDRYVVLDKKSKCPKCKIETMHIATEYDKKTLRKQVESNPNKLLDSYILKLIKGR